MKIKHLASLVFFLAALGLCAQTTAFTYQGQLRDTNGGPATGYYDFTFSVFDTNSGGTAIAGPVSRSTVPVTNGLFTTTVDFGSGAFSGASYWLQVSVRPTGGHSFVALSPRQTVTPAPLAITAQNLAAVSANNTIPAPSQFDTIGGGQANATSSTYTTVSGGYDNSANQGSATVSGGYQNLASGDSSTVSGGSQNIASGVASVACGGSGNTASGDFSFAAGSQAEALNVNSFVWNDGVNPFASTGDYTFNVNATGGVFLQSDAQILLAGNIQMGTISGDYRHFTLSGGNSQGFIYGSYPALGDGIHFGYNCYYNTFGDGVIINSGGATSRISASYGSVTLAVGDVKALPDQTRLYADVSGVAVYGTFNNSSDRNAKQDFAPVNSSQILDKVTHLPISEWSYKTDTATRHIGPMGQDFFSTFNIGTDDKHIAPIDEGGIALAAIQALNQKLETKDAEIQSLKEQLAALQSAVQTLMARK